MQRPVNGRGGHDDPDWRKFEGNTVIGCMSRTRDLARAVHMVIAWMVILLTPFDASAEAGRSYLEMSGGYKAGDFGTTTTSKLFYLSPTLGYVATHYDVSITMPYLHLSNKAGGATASESGMGDVILRGGRILVPEGARGFSLDGALAMKVPTADETKGLGTGETDYGAFLNIHQRFDRTRVSVFSGYIKIGDPPFFNYNDIYLYGMGIAQMFSSTELYTSFEGRRAMVPGAKDPREIHAGFFHVLNADYAVTGNTFAGLNNGGPDFGLSISMVRWF